MVKKRYFWPPLTDDPKLEYIGYFQSDYDVLSKKYGKIEAAIFGREKPKLLFSQPYDVYAGIRGQFFVSEPSRRRVRVIDYRKADLDYLKDRKGVRKQFKQVLGVTGDQAGRVYAVDSLERKIFVFSPDFRLTQEWTNDSLERPVDLAIDDQRRKIYIVDPELHKIVVLSLEDGSFITELGERGTRDDQFNFPLDVDLDQEGNLYVLDALNAKVKVFDPSGRFLRSFGERGTALGSFQMPKAIAVSPSGHVYVTDSIAHRFVVFDLQGQHLLTVGGRYEVEEGKISPGGMYLPQGIDVDSSDGIWVVDGLNRIVHRFQFLTQTYLHQNPILPGQPVVPKELKGLDD